MKHSTQRCFEYLVCVKVQMAETELDRAEKRYAQAKARLLALKNREATKARKLDTRRKIILGGALVDLAERDSNAAAMIERLVRNLPREQDRKAFEGWDAKQPAKAEDPPAPPPVAQGSALPASLQKRTQHLASSRSEPS
jgi:hypothetical protein